MSTDLELTELETIVRDRVAGVVDDVAPDELDLDGDLADEYGLMSLNKVLLLTSVCDDADVALSSFTEHDLAAMRTARDIVAALAVHTGQGAAA
jgi:acyl carrier protein